jgi:hypothetical protein
MKKIDQRAQASQHIDGYQDDLDTRYFIRIHEYLRLSSHSMISGAKAVPAADNDDTHSNLSIEMNF